jgi:hypothetical protein
MINILDPCLKTTIVVPLSKISKMTTSIASELITQQVPIFTDSVSVARGNGNGIDVCGPRLYAISSIPTASASALS